MSSVQAREQRCEDSAAAAVMEGHSISRQGNNKQMAAVELAANKKATLDICWTNYLTG